MTASTVTHNTQLNPTPFHKDITDYLQQEQSELWDWFSSGQIVDDRTEQARLDLLKSCYRIDREAQSNLYAPLQQAAQVLGIEAPTTLYQAESGNTGASAYIVSIPREVHIVLLGGVTELLTEAEQVALYGHELSHYLLLDRDNGTYRTTSELLRAMTNDPQAGIEHHNSNRLFRLYSEVFADRGGLVACGDLSTAVSMSVKFATGLKDVCAESYLKQADEIFEQEKIVTDGITHPESFIRARALRLWAEQADEADAEIERMISGSISLTGLDLLSQITAKEFTRNLLDQALWPKWFQTELVLAHARLFFEDWSPPSTPPSPDTQDALKTMLQHAAPDFHDFAGFILLDLVSADADLEEIPLAHCAKLADKLGIADSFRNQATRELRMTKKQYDLLLKEADNIVTKANKEPV
jgi:hypothetical protein